MKRLAWFDVQDHRRRRRPWRWFFIDQMPSEHAEAGGLCVGKRREVWVLVTLPLKRIAEIVGHELVHVMCDHQTHESIADSAGEERVAQLAEASLLPIMASLGVKLPPFPDGFDAFRRAARKKR